MAISKVSGTAWADISKIDGVLSSSIAKVSGFEVGGGSQLSVVTDNLWIHFDPAYTSGTQMTDLSGNGRHGTLGNGALATTAPDGSNAFYTDGVNDYALYETSSTPSTGFPFTIETWLYRFSTNTTAFLGAVTGKPKNSRYRYLDHSLGQKNGGTSGRGAFSRFYTNNVNDSTNSYEDNLQLELNIATNNGAMSEAAVDNILGTTGDCWAHLVTRFSYNANNRINVDFWINGTQALYIDGDDADVRGVGLQEQNGAWPWEDSSSVCQFGYGYFERYTVADQYQKGYAGDYRLYTDLLTDTEISDNFNATKSKYGY